MSEGGVKELEEMDKIATTAPIGDGDDDLKEVVVVPSEVKVTELPTYYDTRRPQYNENYYAREPERDRQPNAPPSYSESVQRGGGGYQPQYRQTFIVDNREDNNRDDNRFNRREFYDEVAEAFSSRESRNKFIQRVYLILSIQLFGTFGMILASIYIIEFKNFLKVYWGIAIACAVVYFILSITLTCFSSPGRTFPLNAILLAILTFCQAYVFSFISIQYATKIVLGAMGIAGLVCFVVSLFAISTKIDFTTWGTCLCICLLVVMIWGAIMVIISFFIPIGKTVFLIFSAVACLLFVMYLMYDTQQIVGGRRYELSTEDYIFGALCLYIDVMQIFYYVMCLLNSCVGD